MGSHEYEMDALEQIEQCIDSLVLNTIRSPMPRPGEGLFFKPKDDSTRKGGKTLNFQRMGNGLYWLWSELFGSEEDKKESTNILRQFLEEEARTGHMSKGSQVEQCCADPHYNFHVYVMILIWKLARLRNKTVILVLVTTWIVEHFALYVKFYFAGRIVIPGTRFQRPNSVLESSWDVPTVLVSEFFGFRHRGNARNPNHDIWSTHRDYACCRIARKYSLAIIRSEVDFTSDKILPKLVMPIRIDLLKKATIASLDQKDVPMQDLILDKVVISQDGRLVDFSRSWSKHNLGDSSLGESVGKVEYIG